MKPYRSLSVPVEPLPPAANGTGARRGWMRFWFTPADPIGLHVLRVLSGLLVLAWLLSFAGAVDSSFGPRGWLDRQAREELSRLPDSPMPPANWSLLALAGSDGQRLAYIYWSAVVVAGLFTLGLVPRVTAVLTWMVVASFTGNPVFDTDAYALLNVLTFSLMIGYVFAGRTKNQPSLAANIAVRLLQVQVAIAVLVSGLHKLQFGEWWAGVAYWYPLYRPFETTVAAARAHVVDRESYLSLLSLAAYLTLAWQIGFPLFAWRKGWRVVLIVGAALAWACTGWVYGLPWFGPALFIGCVSFVTPLEWQFLRSLVSRFLPFRQAASDTTVPSRPEVSNLKRAEGPAVVAVGQNG